MPGWGLTPGCARSNPTWSSTGTPEGEFQGKPVGQKHKEELQPESSSREATFQQSARDPCAEDQAFSPSHFHTSGPVG